MVFGQGDNGEIIQAALLGSQHRGGNGGRGGLKANSRENYLNICLVLGKFKRIHG